MELRLNDEDTRKYINLLKQNNELTNKLNEPTRGQMRHMIIGLLGGLCIGFFIYLFINPSVCLI